MSEKKLRFIELEPKYFQQYVEESPYRSYLQTLEMAEIRAEKGWEKHFVAVIDRKMSSSAHNPDTRHYAPKILAAAMLVSKPGFMGRKIFYSPGGPLLDFEDDEVANFFLEGLDTYLKQQKAYLFRCDPYYEYREYDIDGKPKKDGFHREKALKLLEKYGYIKMKKAEQPSWIFVLPLRKGKRQLSLEELRQGFRPNTRNLISKAERMGIRVETLKSAELYRFKALTEETAKRRGFQDKPLSYYQRMLDLFSKKGEIRYLLAELNLDIYVRNLHAAVKRARREVRKLENDPTKAGALKEAIITRDSLEKHLARAKELQTTSKTGVLDLSCGMFMIYGDEVIYLFSGNSEEFMYLNAQYLVQYQIIRYAVKRGFKRYNFYGISGNFDKKDPSYGIYEFKKGFGGNVIELIGGFELPVNKPVYYLHALLSKIKNLL